jgi:hypothetical protein
VTRLAEIGHVLVKDIREARRLLLLYLAIVVVATAHSAGLGVFAVGTFGASMVFVMLVGALLAASVVQADSPTRSDAFWATHPFRRSSMLGAKTMFALLVVVVAAIGQAIGLYSYDLHGSAVGWLTLEPALFFGAVLLGAMLLASVTRDLRSFILAAIAIPLVVLVATVFDRGTAVVRDVRAPVQVLGLVAGAAILVWLYLTRDGRRSTRLVTCAVVGSTLMAMCSSPSTPGVPAEAIPTVPPPTITLEPLDPLVPRVEQPGRLPLTIRVAAMEQGIGAQLELSAIDLHLRDGSVLHPPLENPHIDMGRLWPLGLVVPRIAGIRWLGDVQPRDFATQVVVRLTAAQRRAVATGVSSVAVDGRVGLWESRASNTMPLVVGAEATADGHRTRILEWTPEDERSAILVEATSIDRTPGSGSWAMPTTPGSGSWATPVFGMRGFALVNESRREAVPLYRTQSGGSLDGLVLPGVPLLSEQAHLALHNGASPDTTVPDTDWFRSARLMHVTSRYLGSYRIHLQSKGWASVHGMDSRGITPAPRIARSDTPTPVLPRPRTRAAR